jgi:hypothetical protein
MIRRTMYALNYIMIIHTDQANFAKIHNLSASRWFPSQSAIQPTQSVEVDIPTPERGNEDSGIAQ